LGVLDPLAPGAVPVTGTGGEPDGGADGEHGGPDGGGSGPGNGPAGGGTGGTGPAAAIPPGALAAHVNLTVPLATALHLADRPGLLSRIGPVDPALARDLVAATARNPASTWCLTVTGPDGRPVAHGCGRPPPRAGPRPGNPGKQDTPGGGSGEDRGPPGVPGEDRGPSGRYGTIRISTTAFTGNNTGSGRDLVFAMEPLAGPCDHAHQATGHDPGRMLRHLTGILNGTCTFPPCRRPEHQADYEHSKPYEQGGKTCLCESGPVCRQEHRAKQATGWRLEQAGARGWFRWTTPSGRTYLSRPTQYPS
jgi:hypothetical protein